VELQLIDESGRQRLPRDVGTPADSCVTTPGCLLGGIPASSLLTCAVRATTYDNRSGRFDKFLDQVGSPQTD
jgi:hypothetical protein